MKLDLNLLRVILTLCEEKSVTAAAQRLGMRQSALSTALSKLRRTFNDPLFIRTAFGMQPTPRTLALLQPVRNALEIVDLEVLQNSPFEPNRSDRNFVIASSDIGEMVFIPKILDHLNNVAPNMSLRCVNLPYVELARAMESGEVDLALGYFPDLKGNNFFQQRLFSHSFVCVLSSTHPIKGNRITLKQFQEGRHAVVRNEGRSQEIFERLLLQRGIHRRVVLDTSHFLSIPIIISRSDLIATMPLALAATFAKMAGLRIVAPPFDIAPYQLKQHWHRRANSEGGNCWLRALITSLFSDENDEWKDLKAWLPKTSD